MTPDVSLVMPAWRPRPDWLRAAVTSALDEAECDLELLVVDDGSDQPVAPLLAEVGDSRLRVMRVEHGGPYAARNAALREVRGAYVRFVDSDDLVEPGSTGRLLERVRDEPGAIAYGATMMCDEDLAPGEVFTSDVEGDASETCVLGGFEVFVVSLLFPRAVLDRSGPWEESAFPVSGDWDFVLRALEQAPVRRIEGVVTRYRRHRGSVTGVADVAAGAEAAQLVLDRYFGRNPAKRGTDLERRAYLRVHLDRAEAHAWAGQPGPAARQLVLAGRRDPRAALAAAGRISALASRRAARALRRRA